MKNDPAFPFTWTGPEFYYGLTKLEWYAGKALQGLDMHEEFTTVAKHAFDLAEAMIAESEKRK